MAQHRCNISIANNVYKARPLAGILTIDSVNDYYSFRLITHTYEVRRPCLYICFLHTQPSLSAVRDPRTRRSYSSTYSVNDSVTTYYYILVPWTTLPNAINNVCLFLVYILMCSQQLVIK